MHHKSKNAQHFDIKEMDFSYTYANFENIMDSKQYIGSFLGFMNMTYSQSKVPKSRIFLEGPVLKIKSSA